MVSPAASRCADLRELRRRIILVFAEQRRWLGFYSIRFYGRIRGRRERAAYCRAMAAMLERGELLMSHDDDNGFWRFLWVGLVPAPAPLAEVREAVRHG